MSKGKGGTTTQEVKIPEELKQAAMHNLNQAQSVSRLPYAPNFAPQIAAFTPMQEQAFGSVNNAAAALGLPNGGQNAGSGMPTPQNVGGFQGYSPKPFYEAAQAGLPASVRELYDMFFNTQSQAALKEVMQKQAKTIVPKKKDKNSSATRGLSMSNYGSNPVYYGGTGNQHD